MTLLRTFPGVAAAIVLLVAGATSPRAAQSKRLTIAVMEFDNGSTDRQMDPLGKGLAAMVTTDLDAIGRFTVVERQRLADIKTELKLGKSKAFDKKTTAKVGKLVGASHLVTGAFTVVGARMRIDARMVEVKSGKVVATGNVAGDKDAFFELEKGLVKEMIRGAGVRLEPKERAKLAKLHTADFKAFQKFSEGLNHFDSKNYEAAVAAMKSASTIDGDFKLATISLERYEELVTTSANKADAAQVAAVELRKLKRDKKAHVEAMLVSQLSGLVKRKGGNTVDGQLAIHILYDMYRGGWGHTFLSHLRANGDQFALQRTADKFAQAYWRNGMRRPGGLPPYIGGIAYAKPPKTQKEFGSFFGGAKSRALKDAHLWAKSLLTWDTFADRLYMDGKARSRVVAKLARAGLGAVAGDCRYVKEKVRRKACVSETDSARMASAGDIAFRNAQYDLSTRLYMEASKRGKDPSRLKRIAQRVRRNRDSVTALSKLPAALRPWARSTLYATPNGWRSLDKTFSGGTLDDKVARHIVNWHRWPKSVMLVNNTPTWALSGHYYLWTGLRSDRYRSDEIHYMIKRLDRRPSMKQRGLLIHGSTPTRDLSAGFTVVRTLDKVFAAKQSDRDKAAWAQLGEGRFASVSFLFGVRDVEAKGDDSSQSHRRGIATPPRPMTGYAVRIHRNSVELVSFTQAWASRNRMGRESRYLTPAFEDKVLKTWTTPAVKQGTFKVKVSRKGASVTVSIGGASWSATVPPSLGFAGYHFSGTGYASVRKPTLR